MKLSEFLSILSYLINFVWIFPVFRQWNTKYRYFFLITSSLSLLTTIMIVLYYAFNFVLFGHFSYLFVAAMVASVISLFNIETIKKQFIWFLFFIILFMSVYFTDVTIQNQSIPFLILFIIFTLKVFLIFISELLNNHIVNISTLVLIVYGALNISTQIMGLHNSVSNPTEEMFFWAIINSINIIIGIYFIIFRFDYSKLIINFRADSNFTE